MISWWLSRTAFPAVRETSIDRLCSSTRTCPMPGPRACRDNGRVRLLRLQTLLMGKLTRSISMACHLSHPVHPLLAWKRPITETRT